MPQVCFTHIHSFAHARMHVSSHDQESLICCSVLEILSVAVEVNYQDNREVIDQALPLKLQNTLSRPPSAVFVIAIRDISHGHTHSAKNCYNKLSSNSFQAEISPAYYAASECDI